jgi:hypothetical protein
MRTTLLFPALLAGVAATLPGAAQATSTTCSTSVVCAEYINSYSGSSGGVAIHGEANTGIGIRGTSVSNTGFYGASGSGSYLMPGVEGESTNNAGADAAGAFGLSYMATGKAPQFGAVGYGRGDGMYGESESPGTQYNFGYGLFGRETQGVSTGDFNVGVLGQSNYGYGVVAESNGTPGINENGSGRPVGLYAVANKNGGNPAYGIVAESNSTALSAQYRGSGGGQINIGDSSYAIDAEAGAAGLIFKFDYSGNETLIGSLTTSKATYVRTAGRDGTQRIAYGARTATPQIEDVGEGTLTNGRGSVAIDAALANSIDMHRAYHVFLTPEGDCKGLYVTQKSPGGFVVRELQGGRSNIAFEYRVVAKPIDENGERLAVAAPIERPASLVNAVGERHVPAPESPQDVLRRRLGPQAYAKEIAALRNRVTAR